MPLSERRLYGMLPQGDAYGYDPPQRRSSLLDLTMENGRIQAEAAQRSGDIWGNALMGLGQQIAGGIQKHQEEQKIKKRDQAWLGAMNDPEFWKDPKAAYAKTRAIFGPEADERFKEALSIQQLLQPKRDPQADAMAAGFAIRGLENVDPATRPHIWAQTRQAIQNGLGPLGSSVPEQYDEEFFTKIAVPYGKALRGEKEEEYTLAEGGKRFKGDKLIAENPKAPEPPKPDARSIDAQMADAALRGDQDAYNKLLKAKRDAEAAGRAPAGPKEPKLVPQKTVNAAGQEVIRWVTPKPGEEFLQPTGQGKPASGQQRKALSFFNRGKEAGEIADDLEKNIAKYGLMDQGRLAYEGPGSNFAKSPEMQSYRQAQRAFTEARLRKDSGAAVPKEEYDNDAKTYFAQPGDDEATIAQKRASRNAILSSIAFEAGDALQEFFGAEAEGMLSQYRQAGQGQPPAARPRATNPQTGAVVEWDGKAWVPAK